MTSDIAQFDFVVVGAGPAGCTIASRLANAKGKPRVLLVEAGGANDDVDLRIDGNKFIQKLTPSQSWGYKSIPSDYLGNRQVELDRGKGLGGSSAINFTVWTLGPKDDMDTMADVTGDDAWKWERAHQRWKSLENFDRTLPNIPGEIKKYMDPKPENHGSIGPLHIGYASIWDSEVTEMMDIWMANGYDANTDASSGQHLGITATPLTSFKGVRVTAADLVSSPPTNLYIQLNAHVHRVLFEGNNAVGIALVDGRVFHATKEVIICAGSLDSPKILMHSGIGPAEQLTEFGIPVLHQNPNIGQDYRDHYHIMLEYLRADHTSIRPAFFRDRTRQQAALREWQMYRTGEYATIGCEMSVGFFKSDAVLKSSEFERLPAAERTRISAPTIPIYEVGFNVTSPQYYISPDNAPAIAVILVFVLNSQSNGEMRLQSADPTIPLAFNPRFLEHPYDRRVAIESTREVFKVTRSQEFQKNNLGFLQEPASDSEDDILDFWKQNLTSTWHMSGSIRMGKSEEENACVDTDFKVFGVSGLRVADMSIMPFNPSCHTQATAYQIGMIVAEKIAAEYGLE